MTPLNIEFNGEPNIQGSDIARFPKLHQGAPYTFGLKVRYEDETYRDWDGISDMRWRMKLRPKDKSELMTLYKSTGNFTIDEDTLNFVINASDWEGIMLPQSANHKETNVPFSFVIEFLDTEGVVTERFAQGSGLINVNLLL